MPILTIILVFAIFRFMMLKSNLSVKRNLLEKAFGYSRGSRRLSKEFVNRIIKRTSYGAARWGCCKRILLLKRARIREILIPCACCAMLINEPR